MQKIYFCFPFRGIGGVSILFMRIAEYLAKKNIAQCYLIDYEDGYMAKNRDSYLTELVVYPVEGKVNIPDDATVVFQSMTPWSIFPNLDIGGKAKVLFWNCHPLNLIPLIPGFRSITLRNASIGRFIINTILRSFTLRTRRFLSYLIKSNAIVFMDGANLKATRDLLGVKVNKPKFLPIPSESSISDMEKPITLRVANEAVINFLWVGRLVDFKYYPLKRFLIDLSDVITECNYKVTLSVVGAGEYCERIKSDALLQGNVAVKFVNYIDKKSLDRYILENASVMVAMGTSALEGAKLGIPTLVLDFSYSEITNKYSYRWVHESIDYNLGELLFKKDSYNNVGNPLKDKINEVLSCSEQISSREIEYFAKNHTVELIAYKLIGYVNASTCEYGQLCRQKLVGRGCIYSLFDFFRKLYVYKKTK